MSTADRSGYAPDHELWTHLQRVLDESPAFTFLPRPTAADARAAHESVVRTVHQVEQLADRITRELLPADAPMGNGSARSVARSLVRLCRVFAKHWSVHPALAVIGWQDFNKDLRLVVVLVDSCRDGRR